MKLDSVRLLVVEDHAFQRGVLVDMLRSIGVQDIAEAANGREALAALDGGGPNPLPDVIVCDLDMPEMDGVEFLRAVAERHLARGVIIASGRESDILRSVEAMVLASGLAVLGKLRKPVLPDQMRLALARDLPQRPAAAVPAEVIAPELLRRALDERQFHAVFQPKVHLATRALTGVEALARWTPPGAAPVPPLTFVPALTREGLLAPFTDLILEESCRALKSWEPHGLMPGISINISMVTLADLDVVDRVAAHARQHGIDPQRITLEVTETDVMAEVARVLNVLSRLRLKGFQLAIDDFGTGYSSLQQLNTIPFTELKIDQAFVRNCGKSRRLRNILESSIDLAHRLGVRTVAEGVETKAEWTFLAAKGCQEAQGYLIGRPMPAAELPAWAAHWLGRTLADD